jgi:hypothetical protein
VSEASETPAAGGDDERALAVRAEPARGEVLDPRAGATFLDRLAASPLAGPALAATGGFLVGFATFIAARVLRRGGGSRLGARRRRRALERQIESSRSFLVDVHVLRR